MFFLKFRYTVLYILTEYASSLHSAVCTPFHRRRIKTEEKAKVVVDDWGAESVHFFAALGILGQADIKHRMNCSRPI